MSVLEMPPVNSQDQLATRDDQRLMDPAQDQSPAIDDPRLNSPAPAELLPGACPPDTDRSTVSTADFSHRSLSDGTLRDVFSQHPCRELRGFEQSSIQLNSSSEQSPMRQKFSSEQSSTRQNFSSEHIQDGDECSSETSRDRLVEYLPEAGGGGRDGVDTEYQKRNQKEDHSKSELCNSPCTRYQHVCGDHSALQQRTQLMQSQQNAVQKQHHNHPSVSVSIQYNTRPSNSPPSPDIAHGTRYNKPNPPYVEEPNERIPESRYQTTPREETIRIRRPRDHIKQWKDSIDRLTTISVTDEFGAPVSPLISQHNISLSGRSKSMDAGDSRYKHTTRTKLDNHYPLASRSRSSQGLSTADVCSQHHHLHWSHTYQAQTNGKADMSTSSGRNISGELDLEDIHRRPQQEAPHVSGHTSHSEYPAVNATNLCRGNSLRTMPPVSVTSHNDHAYVLPYRHEQTILTKRFRSEPPSSGSRVRFQQQKYIRSDHVQESQPAGDGTLAPGTPVSATSHRHPSLSPQRHTVSSRAHSTAGLTTDPSWVPHPVYSMSPKWRSPSPQQAGPTMDIRKQEVDHRNKPGSVWLQGSAAALPHHTEVASPPQPPGRSTNVSVTVLDGRPSKTHSELPGVGLEENSSSPSVGLEENSSSPGVGLEENSSSPGVGLEENSSTLSVGLEENSSTLSVDRHYVGNSPSPSVDRHYVGNSPSPSVDRHYVGNSPSLSVDRHYVGNSPSPSVDRHYVGNSPSLSVDRHYVGNSPSPSVDRHYVGNSPSPSVDRHYVGNSPSPSVDRHYVSKFVDRGDYSPPGITRGGAGRLPRREAWEQARGRRHEDVSVVSNEADPQSGIIDVLFQEIEILRENVDLLERVDPRSRYDTETQPGSVLWPTHRGSHQQILLSDHISTPVSSGQQRALSCPLLQSSRRSKATRSLSRNAARLGISESKTALNSPAARSGISESKTALNSPAARSGISESKTTLNSHAANLGLPRPKSNLATNLKSDLGRFNDSEQLDRRNVDYNQTAHTVKPHIYGDDLSRSLQPKDLVKWKQLISRHDLSKAEVIELKQALACVLAENDILQAKLTNARQEVHDKLRHTNGVLEDCRHHLSKSQTDNMQLRVMLQAETGRSTAYRDRITDLESSILQMQTDQQQLEHELDHTAMLLDDALSRTQPEIDDLKAENWRLVSRLTSVEHQNAVLRDEVDMLTNKQTKAVDTMDGLRKCLARTRQEWQQLSDELATFKEHEHNNRVREIIKNYQEKGAQDEWEKEQSQTGDSQRVTHADAGSGVTRDWYSGPSDGRPPRSGCRSPSNSTARDAGGHEYIRACGDPEIYPHRRGNLYYSRTCTSHQGRRSSSVPGYSHPLSMDASFIDQDIPEMKHHIHTRPADDGDIQSCGWRSPGPRSPDRNKSPIHGPCAPRPEPARSSALNSGNSSPCSVQYRLTRSLVSPADVTCAQSQCLPHLVARKDKTTDRQVTASRNTNPYVANARPDVALRLVCCLYVPNARPDVSCRKRAPVLTQEQRQYADQLVQKYTGQVPHKQPA